MKAPSRQDRFVKVRAGLSDREFGYDRWIADQFSGGALDVPAILIICHDKSEQDAALKFLQKHEAHFDAAEPVHTRADV